MKEVRTDADSAEGAQVIDSTEKNDIARKLLAEILARRIVSIEPQVDFRAEIGFSYPAVEQALGIQSKDLLPVLESLAGRGILQRKFSDRLLRCSQCQSVNLRPSTHCPKCGSANIVRGRVLEHMLCKYVGLEEEFATRGSYACPKCKVNLQSEGTDYRSIGLLHKCRECDEVFNVPTIRWHCLKCAALAHEEDVCEMIIYSYSLDDARRGWLEFELQPKSLFIGFLKEHGYTVTSNAKVKGRSGGEHDIDILATRDDGIVTHEIAIGVEVGGARIGLDRIFDFDTKTYDSGIHDKMLIVIPELGEEARRFATLQRIKVLQVRDLETVLASSGVKRVQPARKEPFKFQSRSHLVRYLREQGYDVTENAEVTGRSGAAHGIGILATRDDGIVTHRIAIGIGVDVRPVGLERILDLDERAYDAGIPDKVFIAVPGLDREASAFAAQQRIKVFEAPELEPGSGEAPDREQGTPDAGAIQHGGDGAGTTTDG